MPESGKKRKTKKAEKRGTSKRRRVGGVEGQQTKTRFEELKKKKGRLHSLVLRKRGETARDPTTALRRKNGGVGVQRGKNQRVQGEHVKDLK